MNLDGFKETNTSETKGRTKKALPLFIAMMAAGIFQAFSQGFLNANNQSTTPLTVSDGLNSGSVGSAGVILGPGSVYVSLWVGTNGAPIDSLWQVAICTNSSSTFTFAAGTFNLGNPLYLPAPFDGSFKVELLFRAWSISLGPWWNRQWESCWACGPMIYDAYVGQSALLTDFTLGAGAAPPPQTFGPSLLQGITLGHGLVREARSGNVIQWADTVIPAGLTNIIGIAAGVQHRLALKADGTVIAWGTDRADASGLTNIPVQVPPGLSNVIAVSGALRHSLALRADGTVVAWGLNNEGQLDVPVGLTNVVAIAAGWKHSLALRNDGTVVGWGTSGTNVPAGLTNVVAIAAGTGDLALRSDGTVVAWGQWYMFEPRLDVLASVTNAIAISSGYFGWMVLRGDGTIVSSSSGGWTITDAVAISASWGYDFNVDLALRANGTVAWTSFDPYSGAMPADLTNVVAIAAGNDNGLALIGDGPPRLQAPISKPTISPSGFTIALMTQCGRTYRLEYKTSLSDPEWTGLPLVAGTGANRAFTDSTANGGQRFYRVRRW